MIIAGRRGADDTEALINAAESVYAPDKVSMRGSGSIRAPHRTLPSYSRVMRACGHHVHACCDADKRGEPVSTDMRRMDSVLLDLLHFTDQLRPQP